MVGPAVGTATAGERILSLAVRVSSTTSHARDKQAAGTVHSYTSGAANAGSTAELRPSAS